MSVVAMSVVIHVTYIFLYQAIAGGGQVGEQPTFVAVQAGTSQDTHITDGPDGQPQVHCFLFLIYLLFN